MTRHARRRGRNVERFGQVYARMMATGRAPAPIDPRGPRFNQAVLSVGLLAAFLLDLRWAVPALGTCLLVGAALGPSYGPFLRFYGTVIRPRLAAPKELEDPRPPRFAASVGTVFLGGATVAFAAGVPALGWVLALAVAGLAGLAAVTEICVGCEIYLAVAPLLRRRPEASRA